MLLDTAACAFCFAPVMSAEARVRFLFTKPTSRVLYIALSCADTGAKSLFMLLWAA